MSRRAAFQIGQVVRVRAVMERRESPDPQLGWRRKHKTWERAPLVEPAPVYAQVVGARVVQDGYSQYGGEDVGYEWVPMSRSDGAGGDAHVHTVYLVRRGWTNRPLPARAEDLEVAPPDVAEGFVLPWRFLGLSEREREYRSQAASEIARELPRDARGRWV